MIWDHSQPTSVGAIADMSLARFFRLFALESMMPPPQRALINGICAFHVRISTKTGAEAKKRADGTLEVRRHGTG
jgi:hypothetical protein